MDAMDLERRLVDACDLLKDKSLDVHDLHDDEMLLV